MMVVMLVLMFHLFHLCPQAVFLHGAENLLSIQLRPGCGDQARLGIHALQKFCRLEDLLLPGCIRTAHDDEISADYLVVEELAEVASIHLCLAGIYYRHFRADPSIFYTFHRGGHVRKLADSRGFNKDSVRSIVRDHLLECLGEVAH